MEAIRIITSIHELQTIFFHFTTLLKTYKYNDCCTARPVLKEQRATEAY